MNLPISVISHQTTIPANTPDYMEVFDKVEFPNRDLYDLRITNINVSVDTTALYNITSTNKLVVADKTYTIEAGYYTTDSILNVIDCVTIDSNNYTNTTSTLNFTDAHDLQVIFGYNNLNATGKSNKHFDITRGRNVIKIYSSVMKQSVENEMSTLCDCFIYATMGLYNNINFDCLSIPVDNFSTLEKIEWNIRDKNDEVLSIDSPVYISFTISVIQRV